jgi:steroid delta-isomerase-like uncharacterized protein
MSIQENIKIDDEGLAAWNTHDIERFVALCAEDIVWHDVANPEPYRGKEGVRQFMQAWMTAFPNLSAHLKSRVVSEDTVADEIEFSGTNSGPLQMAPGMPAIPATGKTVSNGKGTYFVHVRDGKIVEFNSYPDVAGMMMELGLMPGPKA